MYSSRIQAYLDINPFAKLSNVIAEILQGDIIAIKIPPKAKLNVNKIADDLNVSRTPVLEALSKLASIGFITKGKAANGYYVSGLNMRDLMNLYTARAAIEGEAAYCCAKYAGHDTIEKLEKLLPGFERTLMGKDPAIKDYDLPFHRMIIDASNNKYLISCYEHIYPTLRRYQYYCSEFLHIHKNNPWSEEIRYQHAMIVSPIKSHNGIAAREAMQTHIASCINHATYSYVGEDPFES